MVKRDLISEAEIYVSFTKPAQQIAQAPERRAALDWQDWLRAFAALIATLALIGAVAYGARRLGMLQPGQAGERRLKLVESLMLDPRRRLVIVRWDGREHLLLLGPGGDRIVGEGAVKEEGTNP